MRFPSWILIEKQAMACQPVVPILIEFVMLFLAWPRSISRQMLPPLSDSTEIVGLRLNRTIGSPVFANYFWVSGDELLYLDTESTPPKMIRHNVKTGAQASYAVPPIPGIMDSFRYQNGVTLSPDGRWFLVHLRNPYPQPDQGVIIPSRGSATPVETARRWSVGKTHSVFWSPDSRHFVGVHPSRKPGSYEAVIYDVDDPARRQTRAFSTVLGQSYLKTPSITPEGRLFVLTSPQHTYAQLEEYPVFEPRRTPIIRRMPPDPPSVYWRYPGSISPDGERIFWMVGCEETVLISAIMPLKQWISGPIDTLQRYFGKSGEYIWVTDRDGNNAKSIGRTRHRYISGWWAFDHKDGIEDIRWTPDSKHISFIYKRKLYVRPVP